MAIIVSLSLKGAMKMIKVQHYLNRFQRVVVSVFYIILRIALSAGLGFISAKCAVFQGFSPFSLILLSVCPEIKLLTTICYIGCTLGVLSEPFDLSIFKYITALTAVYIYYMVFGRTTDQSKNGVAFIASLSCICSGFLFMFAERITLFKLLILVCEGVLIFCCIYFTSFAARAFKKESQLTSRELIAASITFALILITIKNIDLFGMNLARIVALISILLAIACLKVSHAVVFGISIGIILSAITSSGEAIFTAVTAATLASCILSTFSNKATLTAFTVFYYTILFFFGKFPWNYWLFSELLIAYCFVCILPKDKLRSLLSAYIPVKDPMINIKLRNKGMLSECKKECTLICPKAKKCYHKNSAEIESLLDRAMKQYNEEAEFPNIDGALGFCSIPNSMSAVIMKIITDSQAESFDELINELNMISKKFESKINASGSAVHFLENEECVISNELQRRRIDVKEITFTEEKGCQRACTIVFEAPEDILYQRIIHEVLSPHFGTSISLNIKPFNGGYVARAKESSNYALSCAALCKTKNGEQISGDAAVGFSVGKSKYCLILADGMGSGKNAGIKSESFIEILQHMLTGGLSVPSAINALRSISRFQNSFTFTTLDICFIDLMSGIAEFYKAGAYDSFYLTENRVIHLKGGGIPLGLSEKDRIIHKSFKICDGDYIVMASDGLVVIESAIDEVLACSKTSDVRAFAHKILQSFSTREESSNDDVTVMVCKIDKIIE